MQLPRLLFILLFCLSAAAAESDKTTLRKLWSTNQYSTNSLPSAWRPADIPATESNLSAFVNFSLRENSLSISNFIAKYGLPNRYLSTKQNNGQDFLIYDLPSGHSVALYVSKPPATTFGACAIITANGSLVKLIK